MKIHRGTEYIHIDLSGVEAAALLEELETVRGGSKLPRLRWVCDGLRTILGMGSRTMYSPPLRIVPTDKGKTQ